jgi:ribosomal protein L40E
MAKFPEADSRWFKNIFVCRSCKAKTRAPILKVLAGKISCRKCGAKALRTKAEEVNLLSFLLGPFLTA